MAFFLLSSSFVSSVTINDGELRASSDPDQGGSDEVSGGDEGNVSGEQSGGDEQQGGEDSSPWQQDGTGDEEATLEDVPPEQPPQGGNQPCLEGEVLNPETGQCEEQVQQEEQLVPDEICDNSVDDDLDGAVDTADSDCMEVQAPEDTGIVEQSRLPSNIGDIVAPGGEAPPPDGTSAPPPLEPPAGPPATEELGIIGQEQLPDIEPPGAKDPDLVTQPPHSTDIVVDTDGDDTVNSYDNCPNASNADQKDSDGDGTGDACDSVVSKPPIDDSDNDGVLDYEDNCPNTWNNQKDSDGDGTGDACDLDDTSEQGGGGDYDRDGVVNANDNCWTDPNPDQKESDGDGLGDVCDYWDHDGDGDGTANSKDNCIVAPNPDQKDIDGDGRGDACGQDDFDADKIVDSRDNCPIIPNQDQKDSDGDGIGDVCDIVSADVVERPRDLGSNAIEPPPDNTGIVEQPRLSDNIGDLVAPPPPPLSTSESPIAPSDESGIVEEERLPDTITTQRTPDTLFKGPNTGPIGVPLPDPVLVQGPNEEEADEEEDKEECVAQTDCDFPYPTNQDEICRNEIDDDLDGRVDEDPYCSVVPGESKPRTPDGVLTPSN